MESVLTVSMPRLRYLISQVIWSPFFSFTTSVFSLAHTGIAVRTRKRETIIRLVFEFGMFMLSLGTIDSMKSASALLRNTSR
jgi:hypothetical protein